MQSVNGAQLLIIIIVQTSPPLTPTPLHEKEWFDFSKIKRNEGGGGGGGKFFVEKGEEGKRGGSTFRKLREMRGGGGSENFC